ncbi:unnamed protein product [Cyprideis torosa]|uniref:Uncharacterized protein n=1 Tax=Cyprideis torosa TaxID=163714 RepID=A0A7R8WHY0_9CRUS|nr:unnamed protein product [Cyprideis torosa]CAG0898062.1 unnamed protein product [Cyprideis torosa]
MFMYLPSPDPIPYPIHSHGSRSRLCLECAISCESFRQLPKLPSPGMVHSPFAPASTSPALPPRSAVPRFPLSPAPPAHDKHSPPVNASRASPFPMQAHLGSSARPSPKPQDVSDVAAVPLDLHRRSPATPAADEHIQTRRGTPNHLPPHPPSIVSAAMPQAIPLPTHLPHYAPSPLTVEMARMGYEPQYHISMPFVSAGPPPSPGPIGLPPRRPPSPPLTFHRPSPASPPLSGGPHDGSLLTLLKMYPMVWRGCLGLKNQNASVAMHFVSGDPDIARSALPTDDRLNEIPVLRIAQRMRLEPNQLDGVARKMQTSNEYCMILALPCGRDQDDVLNQSTQLRTGFITYLQLKQAAGIVNICSPGSDQASHVIHIFPPCDFANVNLARAAPDLLHSVADIAHLVIVITTTTNCPSPIPPSSGATNGPY